ncbi:MAG: galactose mutarotase [Verrucomicrobiota bacterium]|nr:galactose mutarotase [Verrucomicrobiota bacterium]
MNKNHRHASWTGVYAVMTAAVVSCATSPVSIETTTHPSPNVEKEFFGKTQDGQAVDIYTLKNSHGLVAKVMTYGALLTEMQVPDRDGKFGDITLGFKQLEDYLNGHPYFGATAGRYANRIANGHFKLDGVDYNLAKNNDPNHLHGGIKGFDKRVWSARPLDTEGEASVEFTYLSADGEEGYPGNLECKVIYTLTEENALTVRYEASTDKATPINLTNHAYWNLAGEGSGDVLGHQVEIFADFFTPVDATFIPTGEIKDLTDSPLDFRKPMGIGDRIAHLTGDPGGYDHNYVLRKDAPAKLEMAARVTDPQSGRVMEISTTEPGIQFYSGNFLDGTLTGKSGSIYQKHNGFCLETQHFPDTPNKPHFPSATLRPGELYTHLTVHRFSVR